MPFVKEPDDPTRCKGSKGDEQCWHQAVQGSDFCEICGGRDKSKMMNLRGYWLGTAQDQALLAKFSESESIKSLKDEISLARVMIQRHWNMIKSDNDFVNRSPSINTLMLTLERLIKSSHAIEQSLELLLGRQQVISYAQTLVQIIMDELVCLPNYEPVADRIIRRIMETVSGNAKQLSPPKQLTNES